MIVVVIKNPCVSLRQVGLMSGFVFGADIPSYEILCCTFQQAWTLFIVVGAGGGEGGVDRLVGMFHWLETVDHASPQGLERAERDT